MLVNKESIFNKDVVSILVRPSLTMEGDISVLMFTDKIDVTGGPSVSSVSQKALIRMYPPYYQASSRSLSYSVLHLS